MSLVCAGFPILLAERNSSARHAWTFHGVFAVGERPHLLLSLLMGEIIRIAFQAGDEQTTSALSTLTLDVSC